MKLPVFVCAHAVENSPKKAMAIVLPHAWCQRSSEEEVKLNTFLRDLKHGNIEYITVAFHNLRARYGIVTPANAQLEFKLPVREAIVTDSHEDQRTTMVVNSIAVDDEELSHVDVITKFSEAIFTKYLEEESMGHMRIDTFAADHYHTVDYVRGSVAEWKYLSYMRVRSTTLYKMHRHSHFGRFVVYATYESVL